MKEKSKSFYTFFESFEEAEEFASSLSGVEYKVFVEACTCGCNTALVFSVPPGNEHPSKPWETVIYPGPYRRERDLTWVDASDAA